MLFEWNRHKNELLQQQRGISFEMVEKAVKQLELSSKQPEIIDHPNATKYPHQKIMFVELNDYVYEVPFVETSTGAFLKTAYPSRKANKKFRELKS